VNITSIQDALDGTYNVFFDADLVDAGSDTAWDFSYGSTMYPSSAVAMNGSASMEVDPSGGGTGATYLILARSGGPTFLAGKILPIGSGGIPSV
jgi:hypothetical protein